MNTLRRLVSEELSGTHPRLMLAYTLSASLPHFVGSRVRVTALRLAGFDIGHGTLMYGLPTLTGPHGLQRNLHIGRFCRFNVGCYIDLGAPVCFSDYVSIGHQVLLLTTSHEIGQIDRRTGPVVSRTISIGKGVWLGARSVIMPGITIGAGAIVNRDVPDNAIVGGVPARVIRTLSPLRTFSPQAKPTSNSTDNTALQ